MVSGSVSVSCCCALIGGGDKQRVWVSRRLRCLSLDEADDCHGPHPDQTQRAARSVSFVSSHRPGSGHMIWTTASNWLQSVIKNLDYILVRY